MEYWIYYGDIRDDWAKNWGKKNPNDDPFKVLENDHMIYPNPGAGWVGFLLWADEVCMENIKIDWGSQAWKCRGQDLIELKEKADIYEVDSVDPEKTYGIVFIEMS